MQQNGLDCTFLNVPSSFLDRTFIRISIVMKTKFRIVLIVLAMILIVVNLTQIDYGNFTWANNLSPLILVLAMIVLIISLINQIRYDKNQQTNITGNRS